MAGVLVCKTSPTTALAAYCLFLVGLGRGTEGAQSGSTTGGVEESDGGHVSACGSLPLSATVLCMYLCMCCAVCLCVRKGRLRCGQNFVQELTCVYTCPIRCYHVCRFAGVVLVCKYVCVHIYAPVYQCHASF